MKRSIPAASGVGRARRGHALDAGGPADARGRVAADLLDQVVVAPAGADRGLRRLEALVHELEHRARVVVEPAHERRHEHVLDAVGIEEGPHLGEVLLAGRRRATRRSSAPRRARAATASFFVSKTRSGLTSRAPARVLVELVAALGEEGLQPLDVRGAALAVADGVQLQARVRDPGAALDGGEELDQLGVDGRVVRAHRLEADLPELAVAPLLRRRVPEHRADVVRLHGLRLAVEAVLEVGARDRRRPLGPQRQGAARRGPRTCTSPCARRPSPAPDVRANSSVSSNVGVTMRP